jgi:hypothetical protein
VHALGHEELLKDCARKVRRQDSRKDHAEKQKIGGGDILFVRYTRKMKLYMLTRISRHSGEALNGYLHQPELHQTCSLKK